VGHGTTFNPFRWNAAYGYEWTPATGLYHVGAREYDPRTTRWLQRDPIGVAGGHPNVYLYCGNDPINYSDSDGIGEDPGGPKGSIRCCITAFIPTATVSAPDGNVFKGDNRRFSPDSPCYRMQWAFVVSKDEKGEIVVEFATKEPQVGATELVKPRGWKGQARPTSKKVVMPLEDGGVDVIISATASNPYYAWAPPIAWRITFRLDKEGRVSQVHGFHSGYPAFEIWEYTGPQFSRNNPSPQSCAKMLYGYDPTVKNPPVDPWGLFGRVNFNRLFK